MVNNDEKVATGDLVLPKWHKASRATGELRAQYSQQQLKKLSSCCGARLLARAHFLNWLVKHTIVTHRRNLGEYLFLVSTV